MPKKSLKGGRFEREFSKKLSLWWSKGAADDWFWRTAGSGGRATNRAKQGKGTVNSAGDIGAEHPQAQRFLNLFTLELKRGYNDTDIQELLDHKGKSQFRAFVQQAQQSASLAGTPYWWLVLQRDRREELIFTNYGMVIPHTALRVWAGPVYGYLVRSSDYLTDVLHQACQASLLDMEGLGSPNYA